MAIASLNGRNGGGSCSRYMQLSTNKRGHCRIRTEVAHRQSRRGRRPRDEIRISYDLFSQGIESNGLISLNHQHQRVRYFPPGVSGS
ncbi:hypothetical protein D3C87_1969940 [compost metagenome]